MARKILKKKKNEEGLALPDPKCMPELVKQTNRWNGMESPETTFVVYDESDTFILGHGGLLSKWSEKMMVGCLKNSKFGSSVTPEWMCVFTSQ